MQQPFVQSALPIIVALVLAAWLQTKRFDALNRRIDQMIARLQRIEIKVENHNERIARIESVLRWFVSRRAC